MLNRIEIDPRNPRFSCFDNKFIIGKSSETSKTYDILILSQQEFTCASIPSFIKIIRSNAFSFCNQLRCVEFPPDSKLQIIGKSAFVFTAIENVLLHLFFYQQLLRIDIPPDTKLKTIDELAFSNSSIESIVIPPHATQIYQNALSECENLKIIEFTEKKI